MYDHQDKETHEGHPNISGRKCQKLTDHKKDDKLNELIDHFAQKITRMNTFNLL